jgi:hypothetical protein
MSAFDPCETFTVVLRADQSTGSFVDFTTTFFDPIDCRRGLWEVALLDASFPATSKPVKFVCCDIVRYLPVGLQNQPFRVLRTLPTAGTSFLETSSVVPWKKLDTPFIPTLRTTLVDADGLICLLSADVSPALTTP